MECLGNLKSMDIVTRAENRRQEALLALDRNRQSELGQFLTPLAVARIMSSMVRVPQGKDNFYILDPGSGTGILLATMVDRILSKHPKAKIHVTAVETDENVIPYLRKTLEDCKSLGVHTELITQNFIDWGISTSKQYDVVIQNPPYYKLSANSPTVFSLKNIGYIVPNMYSAFMALGAELLKPQGYQIAITPRSWMNGTYYTSFRKRYISDLSIDKIHTFESRSTVFQESEVLQEIIIVGAYKGSVSPQVELSVSRDQNHIQVTRTVPYGQVVTDDFVFVPANYEDDKIVEQVNQARETLVTLGLQVSTGKVVGFRLKNLLLSENIIGACPLLQPTNIATGIVEHPKYDSKKNQWFDTYNETSSKYIVPAGTYVLIKRFTAKEEKRRIVAAVYNAAEPAAFDNKLNYIHCSGEGIDIEIAEGIARWLNSDQVDAYFRVFSGHTQVNATDIRRIPFPSDSQLRDLAHSEDPGHDIVNILNIPKEVKVA